jgi:hypothetical protein
MQQKARSAAQSTLVRRAAQSTLVRRAAALSLGTALATVANPAVAVPSTWTDPDNPSLAGALLMIGGSVVALTAIIALLVYLPSMMGRDRSDEISYSDPEWFGGPRSGVKTDEQGVAPGTGGSGARW